MLADAEFRNTGLERSENLAKDLEWFKEQGHAIPEPSSPGTKYAQYLEELSENDPPAFICHFYNTYFAHSAGGRMIGRKVRTSKFSIVHLMRNEYITMDMSMKLSICISEILLKLSVLVLSYGAVSQL